MILLLFSIESGLYLLLYYVSALYTLFKKTNKSNIEYLQLKFDIIRVIKFCKICAKRQICNFTV